MVYTFETSLAADQVRISIRDGSFAISIGEEAGFSFDGEGRLMTATIDDAVHKRALDHRFVRKSHVGKKRMNVDLTVEETDRLVQSVLRWIQKVLDVLPKAADTEIVEALNLALTWDGAAYQEDIRRFHSVYTPIGILPPDQYMALVLQATEGCHYNRCTFCRFYRETPFRIKPAAEFRRHVNLAIDLIGKGAPLRRSVFLGDANALVTSQRRLLEFFSALNEAFAFAPSHLSGRPLAAWLKRNPRGKRGIYSFIDAFTGHAKPASEFLELRELHLKRIYIGMESGHNPLLDFVAKPSHPEHVRLVVENARKAGINVAVIVMTGIGGKRFAAGHIRDSISTLNKMGLGAGDLIYLSPFREDPESDYAAIARDTGLDPLCYEEGITQAAHIRAGLNTSDGVKVAVYDVDEFVY